MALTSDEMEMIIVDEMNERKPRVKGKEANKFRKEIKSDIALAKKNNWVLEIPSEWQVDKEEKV